MIFNSALLFALLTLVAGAPVGQGAPNSVVQVPVKKNRQHGLPLAKILSNDSSSETHEANLQYRAVRYLINATYGGQQQTGILDTGSSEIFVFSNKAYPDGYNPTNSTTYQKINDLFFSAFGSQFSWVVGTWAKETIGIAGTEVKDYQFAYLNRTVEFLPDNHGIVGLGPRGSETSLIQHPTYLESLLKEGKIESKSFSIFNTKREGEAALLLGGIDTSKYEGKLNTVPFTLNPLVSSFFYSVPFEFDGVQYDTGVIDTGSPTLSLPQKVADSIAARYNATWQEELQGYTISGNPASNLPGLDLSIGGVNVTIPSQDLFFYDEGDWYLAITPAIDEIIYKINILGDPVIKQLYLLFDLDKSQLGFAPVKFTNESTIVPVGSSIPDSQPAPNQQSSPGCIIC